MTSVISARASRSSVVSMAAVCPRPVPRASIARAEVAHQRRFRHEAATSRQTVWVTAAQPSAGV